MATYNITSPDGQSFKITAPDNASESEVMDYAQRNFSMLPKDTKPLTKTDKLIKGAVDPIEGGAQLLTHLLPQGVVDAGNSFNNWLADKTGLVAKLPQGGLDQQIKQDEATYQAQRKAQGETGFDGYRMLGNVASPTNIALAAKLPQAASLAGRVGVGMAGGGASSVLDPVTGDSFWGDKNKTSCYRCYWWWCSPWSYRRFRSCCPSERFD
jgi:hypothetical protein